MHPGVVVSLVDIENNARTERAQHLRRWFHFNRGVLGAAAARPGRCLDNARRLVAAPLGIAMVRPRPAKAARTRERMLRPYTSATDDRS